MGRQCSEFTAVVRGAMTNDKWCEKTLEGALKRLNLKEPHRSLKGKVKWQLEP